MSIATAIQNAQNKIAAAYTACNNKGATMPATQDLANLDDCIASIPTGGTTPGHTFTGTVDSVGLAALGWDSYDIQWLQDHVWWDAADNAYWAVSQANLEFGPNGSTPLTWATRANIKTNPDVRYLPKFDPSPSSNTSWANLLSGYVHLYAVPTHGWDTSKVTNLYAAFQGCYILRSVGDLSGWDVSLVTTMNYMFASCYALITPGDLSSWTTSACTAFSSMFQNCNCLLSVGDLSNWDTSAASGNGAFSGMFQNCVALRSVGDLGGWDVSGATKLNGMFGSCQALESLGDLSDWETGSVTDMSQMFFGCFALTYIGDISDWDVTNVTTFSYFMYNASSLRYVGNLSSWNTKKATNKYCMFSTCKTLPVLSGISSWDMSLTTDVRSMFASMAAVTVLDLSGWDLSAVTNISSSINDSMFNNITGCRIIKLGPKFFNFSPATLYMTNCSSWTRDSVYESLYTNQTLRSSSSPAKTVKLANAVYDSLSASDISDIATKNITLTRG